MKTKLIALSSLLGVLSQGIGWADPAADAIHQPNNDAYTTAPGVPASTTTVHPGASKSRRHKRKATVTETRASTSAAVSPPAIPPGNNVIDGIGNGTGPNHPGNPNMGTSDHIPGTTGTSGQ